MSEIREGRRGFAKYGHVGIQFAATIGLLCYGGIWLDRRLGLSPLFTILGVFLGFGIALYHLLRSLRASDRSTDDGTAGDRRP